MVSIDGNLRRGHQAIEKFWQRCIRDRFLVEMNQPLRGDWLRIGRVARCVLLTLMLLLPQLVHQVFILALKADHREYYATIVDEDLVPHQKFLSYVLIVNHKEVLVALPSRICRNANLLA